MSPWKTASSTCHDTLESYNESSYDRFFEFNPYFNRVVHQHLTLAELLALPEGQMGYKIGAFVRNPYDRAYSGFIQIQHDYNNQPTAQFQASWIRDLVCQQISENMSRVIQSGFDFNEWIEILPDYEVFDVGRNTNMVLHPAHYWTHVNGRQRADFIGKVEDFENDFGRFCEFVEIEPPAIVSSNIAEPAFNRSSGGTKYGSRMSRRALDRLNELFHADFDLFGYERL